MMISPDFKFEEFFRQVHSRDYQDMINLTNQEATEAERYFHKIKVTIQRDI